MKLLSIGVVLSLLATSVCKSEGTNKEKGSIAMNEAKYEKGTS
jgi:hypothetical protein